MSRFNEARVVVTGGSSGIGAAVVHAFVVEGARVVAVGRDRARLDEVRRAASEPARVHPATADLADPDAARRIVDDAIAVLGDLDVLVNNAGIAPSTPALEVTERQWRATLAVNLDAPFFASQVAARHMLDRGEGGSIVNMASTDSFRAEAPQVDYNTSKAALVMMSRSLAVELGPSGIRVNCVAPGETATPMVEADLAREDFREAYLRRIPLRRVASPAEIARVVLFLASPEASFITGETIVVDGGQLAGDWYDPRDEPPVPPG
jgi:NAD(P)-dependent dehydrogenase (short-subunit alcohol dehydrogenase family)